jgi:hypothetical protein
MYGRSDTTGFQSSPCAALQEAPCEFCVIGPAEVIAELLRTDLVYATIDDSASLSLVMLRFTKHYRSRRSGRKVVRTGHSCLY